MLYYYTITCIIISIIISIIILHEHISALPHVGRLKSFVQGQSFEALSRNGELYIYIYMY